MGWPITICTTHRVQRYLGCLAPELNRSRQSDRFGLRNATPIPPVGWFMLPATMYDSNLDPSWTARKKKTAPPKQKQTKELTFFVTSRHCVLTLEVFGAANECQPY